MELTAYEPTAVQSRAAGHATPSSSAVVAPGWSGTLSSVHRTPFHRNARVLLRTLFDQDPTAMQSAVL